MNIKTFGERYIEELGVQGAKNRIALLEKRQETERNWKSMENRYDEINLLQAAVNKAVE